MPSASAKIVEHLVTAHKAEADAEKYASVTEDSPPIVRLATELIENAHATGASDIHIEPQENEVLVRYRVDGVLRVVNQFPRQLIRPLVSRLKIMADIDITETRHPQDGHISMAIGEAEFDIRIATLPTYLGERVVLRLLDQSSVLSGVADLGLEPEDEARLQRIIHNLTAWCS